jgi:outer membrane immunogenic protein
MIRLFSILCALIGVSGAAFAADLPPAPPRAPAAYAPPVLPIYNWTGFYIGGNLGAAWTSGNVSDSNGNSWSNSQQATFTGGGQVGFNYQINWFVAGLEADFDWLANNKNSSNAIDTNIGAIQFSANNRWMTTLAARVGVAADNWLFYAKGGGGWVGVGNPTITNLTTGGSISVSNSNSNSGWLVGAGVEWGFAPNWTARLEYDFLGLSNQSRTVTGTIPLGSGNPACNVATGCPFTDTITQNSRDVQTLTLGINYLFR